MTTAAVLCGAAGSESPRAANAASNQPSLASEIRDIGAALAAVHAFIKRADPLDKKTKISKEELDGVSADAEAVKRTISQFQRGVSSAVSKLQGAGKWSELDALVETRFREQAASPADLQALKARGGARAVLQNAQRLSTDLGQAVDQDVKNLRTKTAAARLLDELLGRPVHASLSLRLHYCTLYLGYKVVCSASGGEACTDVLIYGDACRS